MSKATLDELASRLHVAALRYGMVSMSHAATVEEQKEAREELRRAKEAMRAALHQVADRNAELEEALADRVKAGLTLYRCDETDDIACRIRLPRAIIMAAKVNATQLFAMKLEDAFRDFFAKQEARA